MANQFKGFTSHVLRAEFPHLKSRMPTLWSSSYFAAIGRRGSADTVEQYINTQWERPWTEGQKRPEMVRAYKFLMRPTVRQAQALAEMLRDHCSLYNGALQERRDAYRHASKTSVKYGMQSAQLKDIRAFDPERQGRWSFSSQQATLRRLDKAFAAFFRRVKSGETPGYPRFRGVNWFDTVEFPKDGDGCRWDSTPHDPVTRVRFQGVGHVKVNQHRAGGRQGQDRSRQARGP